MLEVHIQLNLLSIIRCHARNKSYTSSGCRMYPCDNIPLFYYHICQPGAERPTFLHDFKNTIDATNCCIPSKPQILKSSKRSVGIYRFSSTFNTIIYHKLTTLRRFSHWIERQKKKQTNKKKRNAMNLRMKYHKLIDTLNFVGRKTLRCPRQWSTKILFIVLWNVRAILESFLPSDVLLACVLGRNALETKVK